ncbi:MAG: beta-ketoacyl synthase chain length factor [Crocinitomicaceae bacterium]
MYYIHSRASITCQDSFRTDNVCEKLVVIDDTSDVVSPEYKEFIPPASLRRLSPVLKMGLTASIECKNQSGKDFDAIVVGTGLGCLKDTEKFLSTFLTSTSDFLSPTAFIQSTHNTIGGQISLGLGNHAYNMTHTQNSVSFEVSLLDAMMCINEGKNNVLVGAADEKIDFLKEVQPNLISADFPLCSGASFFVLSPEKSEVQVKAISTTFSSENVLTDIAAFLDVHNLEMEKIDLLLHSNDGIEEHVTPKDAFNFLDYSGFHYSASAFALHIAHDYLVNEEKEWALIVNDMCPTNIGIMLIQRDEA